MRSKCLRSSEEEGQGLIGALHVNEFSAIVAAVETERREGILAVVRTNQQSSGGEGAGPAS